MTARLLLSLLMILTGSMSVRAQYNIDRLITIGRSALYFEDYVLSMQYFNQAIAAKPYLYEPWFLRGVAKYNLDDFAGAEQDCTEAIERNPYVVRLYELRGIARIQQKKYTDAISDYNRALRYNPDNRSLWHNRVLCHIQNDEFDEALLELDTIQARWSQYAPAWNMRADVYMQQEDTTRAIESLDSSLALDPYDGTTWAARSIISLSRKEWPNAEEQLDHAIHLLPKNAGYYINRALARYNQNNLRGAMADYDAALDLEPNNFLGHYNRGLLRADVGDDNRAITDFDFVLGLEPDNMLALFNRALLLDRTGDLNGAVRDYTRVIDEYPTFHTAMLYRARCYRRMGLTAKAELDEFQVYKAQLYQHLYGIQPQDTRRDQRKRSDLDPNKYNQLVVADEQEPDHEYQSEYRGRVQDRRADMQPLPLFALSLQPQSDGVRQGSPYDEMIEQLNGRRQGRPLYITTATASLSSQNSADYFTYIDSLTLVIDRTAAIQTPALLLARAVARSVVQDNEAALADLQQCLALDTTLTAALWQQAVCQARMAQLLMAEGSSAEMRIASALGSTRQALDHSPSNAYLLYNSGCLKTMQQQYQEAIADFSAAIDNDPRLAEAYFNRALCLLQTGQTPQAIADLSKAGEMGIYQAYSIIKKVNN
ncbi:MAG: tetratricopeptide repeat protein [Prevotella sp.]|nr:tetratricopeptide repeat protein [Prevotella sp.]